MDAKFVIAILLMILIGTLVISLLAGEKLRMLDFDFLILILAVYVVIEDKFEQLKQWIKK